MKKRGKHFSESSKKSKLILVSICVIGLAMLILAAFFMLNGKSSKKVYIEYEKAAFKKHMKYIKHEYAKFYNSQLPYLNESYRDRMEISASLEWSGDVPLEIQNAGGVIDIIGKSKLIIDKNADPKRGDSVTDVSLLIEKSPFIDARIISSDNRMRFSIPVILPDKWFSLDRHKIDEVYDKFNIPLRPKRVIRMSDIAGTLYFHGEKLDGTAGEYGRIISDIIQDSDVKLGEKRQVTIGDEQVVGREITITLGEEKTKDLMQGLAQKGINDETLLKLTYFNYAEIIQMLDDTGLFQTIDFLGDAGYFQFNDSIDRFIRMLRGEKDLEGLKNSISQLIDASEYPEGFNMKIVADKAGNILDRKINITFRSRENDAKSVISVHSGISDLKEDSFNNWLLEIQVSKEYNGGEKREHSLSLISDRASVTEGQDRKGNISVDYLERQNGSYIFGVEGNFDIDSSLDKSTLRTNSNINYDIRFIGENSSIVDTFKGKIERTAWENKKHKTKNRITDMVMDIDMPSADLGEVSVKLKTAREDKFGIEVTLPEVGQNSDIDLDAISEDQLSGLMTEIMASFGRFYLENKSIFDMFMK